MLLRPNLPILPQTKNPTNVGLLDIINHFIKLKNLLGFFSFSVSEPTITPSAK